MLLCPSLQCRSGRGGWFAQVLSHRLGPGFFITLRNGRHVGGGEIIEARGLYDVFRIPVCEEASSLSVSQ